MDSHDLNEGRQTKKQKLGIILYLLHQYDWPDLDDKKRNYYITH
jgi:hypothetical protein